MSVRRCPSIEICDKVARRTKNDGDDVRTSQQASAGGGPDRRARSKGGIRVIGVAVVVTAVLAMTRGAGFRRAASCGSCCAVPTEEVALQRDADGIVVLTGGASRMADAVELLAAGHGKRLLITGVHRATPRTRSRA